MALVLPAAGELCVSASNSNLDTHVKKKEKIISCTKGSKKRTTKGVHATFVRGKQKRVKRPPTIDGIDADEFIRRNADPIWLHQNEMWEYIEQPEDDDNRET